MSENKAEEITNNDPETSLEFELQGLDAPNSPVRVPAEPAKEHAAAAEPVPAERSPEFLELASPKLPPSSKGNRARLLMQSPNRLFFYWSIGRSPFHTLSRALGQPGGYQLVLKFVDLGTGDERLHPVEESGNWWFDVDADASYRAEIGFYAVNRPYIRILYSNTVATPRKSPSPRLAESAEWRVPAQRFARVLDAAGFKRDAFDVAVAGDDPEAADLAARSAFSQFTARPEADFASIAAAELRYALFALASGVPLAELRGLISETLFRLLSSVTEIEPERAMSALQERFDFDADEVEIDDEGHEEAVFGASAVNFPKRTRRMRKPLNALLPGSHSLLR